MLGEERCVGSSTAVPWTTPAGSQRLSRLLSLYPCSWWKKGRSIRSSTGGSPPGANVVLTVEPFISFWPRAEPRAPWSRQDRHRGHHSTMDTMDRHRGHCSIFAQTSCATNSVPLPPPLMPEPFSGNDCFNCPCATRGHLTSTRVPPLSPEGQAGLRTTRIFLQCVGKEVVGQQAERQGACFAFEPTSPPSGASVRAC